MPGHTVFERLEVVGGLCDLCGDNHAVATCPVLSHLGAPGRPEESHLAYQTLPEWVEVQEGTEGVRLFVMEGVPRLTRLGPLLAPHTPHLHPHTTFPLKICHEGGSYTYLDLSRKWLCNWLSLVPVGSPTNKNLLACQVDDLIYYMVSEDIEAGGELLVWYAPFYQQRVEEELRQLGSNQNLGHDHSLLGAAVVTRRFTTAPSLLTPHSESPPLAVASSLARISVGCGQVTFTHNNTWLGEEVTHLPGHSPSHLPVLSPVNDFHMMGGKCDARDTLVIRHTQAGTNPTTEYLHNGFLNSRKESDQVITRARNEYSLSARPSQPEKSVQVIKENGGALEKDCVVSLTITATEEEGQVPHWSHDTEHPSYGDHNTPEDWHSDTSIETSGKTALTSSQKNLKRKYRKSREKKSVLVADSSLVKQLPLHALGVRQPRPWTCNYCGQNYRSPTIFADHMKAHLLWLVGRVHVCEECGLSLSNPDLLHQHFEKEHATPLSSPSLSSATSHHGKKRRCGTGKEEEEEDVDDPGERTVHKLQRMGSQDTSRIAALPTEAVEGPHYCQICGKSFDKPRYFLRHLRKHSGDFTCQVCLKVFARKEGLQKHQCSGGGKEQRLSCSLCSRTFLSQALLQRHTLKHKGCLKCTQCGRSCATLASLQRHVNLCPSVQVSKFFECTECGKKVGSAKQLERHVAQHHQNYLCHVCNKTYNNSTYLAQHIPLCRQMHRLASLGCVSCEDCNQEFTDSTTFRVHHATHTHPFHCSTCSHRFQTRVSYEVHVCEVQQRCDECGAVFRTVQALNRHAAVHGLPSHACPSCSRSYYRKASLDRHLCSCEGEIKKKKVREQSFPCHLCGSVLATRYRLTTHMRTAHGGGREVMCEVCGKGFQRRDLLKEHQSVHAPPTHPCPTCHKLFKTRKGLDVHSLIHLDIKRFACKYCNKKFHQKANLGRHERSHLPRGSVKCQYCATHCSSTADLKAHLLSHTVLEEKLQEEHCVFAIKKEDPETDETLASLEPESGDLSLTEKERLGLKSNLKENKELNSDFDSGIVHSVITSDLDLHTNDISDPNIDHQTVFIPQRISNICLSTREEPLNSKNYIVTSQPSAISSSASSQNICNSSVFKVTNDSSSVEDTLPSTVLITTSPVPPLDTSHLGPPEHCQVSVVQAEGADDEHLSTEAGKISQLTLGPSSALVEEVCLYRSTSATSPDNTSQHHLVESVVLMAEPPISTH